MLRLFSFSFALHTKTGVKKSERNFFFAFLAQKMNAFYLIAVLLLFQHADYDMFMFMLIN